MAPASLVASSNGPFAHPLRFSQPRKLLQIHDIAGRSDLNCHTSNDKRTFATKAAAVKSTTTSVKDGPRLTVKAMSVLKGEREVVVKELSIERANQHEQGTTVQIRVEAPSNSSGSLCVVQATTNQQHSETKEDLAPINQQLVDVYTSRICGESSLTVTIVVPRRPAQLGQQLLEIRLLLATRTLT